MSRSSGPCGAAVRVGMKSVCEQGDFALQGYNICSHSLVKHRWLFLNGLKRIPSWFHCVARKCTLRVILVRYNTSCCGGAVDGTQLLLSTTRRRFIEMANLGQGLKTAGTRIALADCLPLFEFMRQGCNDYLNRKQARTNMYWSRIAVCTGIMLLRLHAGNPETQRPPWSVQSTTRSSIYLHTLLGHIVYS